MRRMSEENPPLPPPSLPPQPSVSIEPPASTSEDHTWALVLHLSALLHLLGASFPGVNIVGPLVIWLIKKPDSPYLDEVGKRVLNFQISWAIYFAVLWLSLFVIIGFVLLPIGFIAWLAFTIIGAIKESNREPYDFPLTIQFLK